MASRHKHRKSEELDRHARRRTASRLFLYAITLIALSLMLRDGTWLADRSLVLIGILGGMQSFGLVGLFLGPVIMATLLTVWREWIGIQG